MKHEELLNLQGTLGPHGEDGVAFQHAGDDLVVDVFYNERAEFVQLLFQTCSYLFFAPMPGFCPQELQLDFDFKPGRLYELFDSGLLRGSGSAFSNPRFRPNGRHFFIHLGWANIVLHVVASGVALAESAAHHNR